MGSAGTQPLPESQLDRFMICLSIGYPNLEKQIEIIKSVAMIIQLKELRSCFKRKCD